MSFFDTNNGTNPLSPIALGLAIGMPITCVVVGVCAVFLAYGCYLKRLAGNLCPKDYEPIDVSPEKTNTSCCDMPCCLEVVFKLY